MTEKVVWREGGLAVEAVGIPAFAGMTEKGARE